jgi:hypothetical protein
VSTLAERFAADDRLVVFVGAGVSSIPPTCLPSWWAMDRAKVLLKPDSLD